MTDMMGQWEAFESFFDNGIPYGAYICTAFIIGLCAYGLIKSRKIFREI